MVSTLSVENLSLYRESPCVNDKDIFRSYSSDKPDKKIPKNSNVLITFDQRRELLFDTAHQFVGFQVGFALDVELLVD